MFKTFLFIVALCSSIFAQRMIELNFTHSLRIPYHTVKIKISERFNDPKYEMVVIATPSDEDKRWENTRKNFKKTISKEQFDVLYGKLMKLNTPEILLAIDNSMGLDGNDCELSFGSYQNYLTLSIWTPSYNTQKRKLSEYLDVFKQIITVSGLPTKDIID